MTYLWSSFSIYSYSEGCVWAYSYTQTKSQLILTQLNLHGKIVKRNLEYTAHLRLAYVRSFWAGLIYLGVHSGSVRPGPSSPLAMNGWTVYWFVSCSMHLKYKSPLLQVSISLFYFNIRVQLHKFDCKCKH